ncbi:MAG TPA: formate dehydrogenase accessory sulfurtransferase FdhD [Terriglobales bacterium]
MARSQHNVDLTNVTEWQSGQQRRLQDYLVVEEPLEIRIHDMPLTVTMRTPGQDVELAAGFLWTEGLIEDVTQIGAIRNGMTNGNGPDNRIDVELKGVTLDRESLQRNFFAASSCGICGKSSIDAVRRRGLKRMNSAMKVSPDLICSLPGKLKNAQAIFGRTGGLHAAAVFDGNGELLAIREDVGRHNAVDKIVGWALTNGKLPLSDSILMVSARGGFEIVQKAVAAGFPVAASVSAPSGLAVQLAREMGLTLIGFVRDQRFVVYAGEERCVANP